MLTHRSGARLVVVLFVAIAGLFGCVWLVAAQASSGVKDSEAKARQGIVLGQITALRRTCPRAVSRDFELRDTNMDLLELTTGAARKRIEIRIRMIERRLPASETKKVIAAHCAILFPLP